MYNPSGGDIDTVIVGRVVLVLTLDLCESTEGRETLEAGMVGDVGVDAATSAGGILRYVERVGDGNDADDGDVGGEGAWMDP